MSIRPPVKTYGGKFRIKDKIIDLFPPNYEQLSYCEPFAGGASILLNKKKSKEEIWNDLDWWTYNLFVQIKDNHLNLLSKLCCAVYEEKCFKEALDVKKYGRPNLLTAAYCEFVTRRMSRVGLGKDFSWSTRLRGGQPESQNAWCTSLENLALVSKRLQNVELMNMDAIKLIEKCNGTNWFLYEDPPYVKSTRKTKDCYVCEMTDEQHKELAKVNNKSTAKILISGYSSDIYNKWYKNWNKVEFKVKNNAGQTKTKSDRIEVCWMNF